MSQTQAYENMVNLNRTKKIQTKNYTKIPFFIDHISHICSHACSWKGKLLVPTEDYMAVWIPITNNPLTQQFPPLGIYPTGILPHAKWPLENSLDVFNMGPVNNGSSVFENVLATLLLARY